jgi:hypothetical protein
MAEIWFFSGVDKPVEEVEVDERPFGECVETLELSEARYLGEDPTQQPVTVITNQDRYLVVAVGEDEASNLGWKPGYYQSPLDPTEALQRLGLGEPQT